MDLAKTLAAAASVALAVPAQAAPPPADTDIAGTIAAARLPLDRAADGSFSGTGWQRLVEDAETAQFTMVGEQHGSGSIAEFETALYEALAVRGYTHSALEVGPFSTRYVEKLVRSGPGRLQSHLKAPGNGFAVPFLFFGEEARMAEQMVARSPDRAAALWGLDQEFIGGGPLHADLLEAYARTPEQKAAVASFRVASVKDVMFSGKLTDAELAPLRAAFAMDPRALELLSALAASSAIYRPFIVRGAGDVYAANLARETMMKRNFLAAFTDAEQRMKSTPKVFLKFGASHAMRGHSSTNVPALGNFLAEWGTARRLRLVNMFIECDGGEALNPQTGKPAPCEPYFAKDAMIRRVVEAGPPLQFYDLRPLRSRLSRWKDLDPASRQLILAFDYYVTIRGGRAAEPLATPPVLPKN